MKLSIIIAACLIDKKIKNGNNERTHLLDNCLSKILLGGYDNFEVLVGCDGDEEKIKNIVAKYDDRFSYHPFPYRGVYSGGPQRNGCMKKATGDFLIFIDDDDWYVPGALDRIATLAKNNPGHPIIWCMEYRNGRKLWIDDDKCKGKEEGIPKKGHVGTPMIGLPNIPDKLGVWGKHHYSDGEFVESTLKNDWPKVIWSKEVMAKVRMQGDREPW